MKTNFSLRLLLIAILFTILAGCFGSDSVEENRQAGKKAFEEKQYAKAREFFLKGIARKPSDKDLLLYVGQAYEADYMYDSALFYYRRVDILYPKDRDANRLIHKVSIALEQWKTAIMAIHTLAKSDSAGYIPYHAEMASLWEKAKIPKNSLYWGRQAIEAGTADASLFVRTSDWALQCDSINIAKMLLDSALVLFGENNSILFNKARILIQMEKYKQAEKILWPLASVEGVSWQTRFTLANSLVMQDSQRKQKQALDIYLEIKDYLPPSIPIDSIINSIK